MRRRLTAFAVVVAAALSTPIAPLRAAESSCDRFSAGTVAGRVKNARLLEISGLVASRRHPGVYWTHNDSGGKPEVFALTLDGSDLGSYALTGANATDWEEIAIGPKHGASGAYLYVGDIGDNNAVRDHVTIYRVAEPNAAPKLPGTALAGVEKIDLVYPDGAEDAEAMLVDPLTGELVIVTKSVFGRSRILTAAGSALTDGARVTMTDRGIIQIVPVINPSSTFPGTYVTGADISADGSLVLLRTYQAVMAFSRASSQSVTDALEAGSCNAPQSAERQGESIAIAADGSRYATISEGTNQAINVFGIGSPTAAPAVATTAPATTTTEVRNTGGLRLPRSGYVAAFPLAFAALVIVAVLRRPKRV